MIYVWRDRDGHQAPSGKIKQEVVLKPLERVNNTCTCVTLPAFMLPKLAGPACLGRQAEVATDCQYK